ncbi:sulfurtransferase [Marinomonas sp. 2405UD68-3]|uniref:sulfurtransferase n=1 Tax=Marinomonas sp. 2405UD68-3 TaxID=3391835 RepID=UPI0039C9EA3C
MLISSDELISQLRDTNVVVLDSRFYLSDHNKGRQLFLESHIPNARFVDLHTQLSSEETEETGRHPLPSIEDFIETVQLLGITQDSLVVVYDDMGGAIASRCWWMLNQLGVRACVLDGGITRWLQKGLPIESGEATSFSAVDKIKCDLTAFSLSVDEQDVIQNYELNQFCLLDARAEERFSGEVETIDPVAGHIPGAKNRPFSENLDSNGCFKSPKLLKEEFEALMENELPFVHYCGSGVTACHNVLALNIAGIEQNKVFVGSWSLWSKRMMRLVIQSQEDV